MKKLTLTIAIVLGMTLGLSAQQQGGGLFERGYVSDEVYYNSGSYYGDYFDNLRGGLINLPDHGLEENQDAPLGSGIAVLLGLGAAYAVAKKRKED